MEQHPVPQNVIDVEFKLFGSFTLKQFSKIILACLAALGFYLMPLPDLIKLPAMGISVILGIGLAIVPNLGIWLVGYVKAIFISPRYVWIRETRTPDLLMSTESKQSTNAQSVGKSTANKKVDIDDLDLNKLFPTQARLDRTENKKTPTTLADGDKNNFSRVYKDVFQDDSVHSEVDNYFDKFKTEDAQIPASAVKQDKVSDKAVTSNETLAEKISRLKMQLSLVPKDANYKVSEEQILNEINELYSQMKANNAEVKTDIKSNDVKFMKNSAENAANPAKIIAGIVVDKSDKPIPAVVISFKNLANGQLYRTSSLPSGKFSTNTGLPLGDYEVSLQHDTYKFHVYKINIGDQPSPLYKFRVR